MTTSTLKLLAPLSGWCLPLEEVPDAAFADRMLGDGVAIDPTGMTLHAPCDGEVAAIAPSNHAVTLRTAEGVEVLMHVGVDTVKLDGRGFALRVRMGDRVTAGQPLLDFDMDEIAGLAPSLVTPIVILDSPGLRISRRNVERSVQAGEFLLEIVADSATASSQPAVFSESTGRRFVVALEHGIHARPAALLVQSIKNLSVDVSMLASGRAANGRSAVALMALGVRRGDEVEVRATGADAATALALLETALTRAPESHSWRVASPRPVVVPVLEAAKSGVIRAVVASAGIAVGRVVHLTRVEPRVEEMGRGAEGERAALTRARESVKARIQQLAESATVATREVLEAHLAFLDDSTLIERSDSWIQRGRSAGFAWRQAVNEAAADLCGVGDERLRERVEDLHDLAAQVILALAGKTFVATLPEQAIVLADELLPSQFVALSREHLAGICVGGGGPTSHVAILATATGIPMLVAAGPSILAVTAGTTVVLDADEGRLLTAPTADELQAAENTIGQRRGRQATALANAKQECRTADGVRIEVFANVGSPAEARAAMEQGAEGCGLLRTEFLFLDREAAPDELSQTQEYQEIAAILSGQPLVIRTLDAGGDKPIPYLPMPAEENPALGLRGVRTSLWRPDLLRTQLRAVLAVRPAGQCRVMLPMITASSELRAVRAILEEERARLAGAASIALGIMVETPAAALQASSLAAEADFLSIGTNDLTQYTLAMDRGHPQLAGQLDALHPAVLRLIAATAEGARRHGRKVSVCGGVASDLAAAPILIGLGVQGLSAVPAAIALLKSHIRSLDSDACRALAARALEQDSAAAVRALIASTLQGPP